MKESKSETWHCEFCGHHWEGGPPTVIIGFHDSQGNPIEKSIQCCPFCNEFKGLEPCDPETCDVRHLEIE
jgi:hypothetical protein